MSIYTIEFSDVNKDEQSTDYYTSFQAVKNFVHLLCCAGYNEMYDDCDNTDLSSFDKFYHQTFRKDGKYFSIRKQFVGTILRHRI